MLLGGWLPGLQGVLSWSRFIGLLAHNQRRFPLSSSSSSYYYYRGLGCGSCTAVGGYVLRRFFAANQWEWKEDVEEQKLEEENY